jgi:hypothetical protein
MRYMHMFHVLPDGRLVCRVINAATILPLFILPIWSLLDYPTRYLLTTLFRYSEFDRLRENLVKAFPHAEGSIPKLPRKSVVSRFRPRFLEQRKNGLSHFIKYVSRHFCEINSADVPCVETVVFCSTPNSQARRW